jgi:hypothetical protein
MRESRREVTLGVRESFSRGNEVYLCLRINKVLLGEQMGDRHPWNRERTAWAKPKESLCTWRIMVWFSIVKAGCNSAV